MYFIDRKQVEKTASHMEDLFGIYDNRSNWSDSPVGTLAMERIVHNLIESVIDIGNTLIDGFIMRDPGSYEDIIDILLDEKVIEADMEAPLKQLLSLRKMIVREFMDVDSTENERVLHSTMPALRRFPDSTRRYLAEELGPVSAFLPEDDQ